MTGIRRTLAILISCGALAPSSALAQDTWSLQPTPNVGEASEHNRLFEVGCDPTGLDACTAVGIRSPGFEWPVALRWDGVSWSAQAPAKKVSAYSTRLYGVDCPSATRCLAVGNYETAWGSPAIGTVAELWTGSSWSMQSTPNPPNATSSELTDVGCNNTAECVAVGSAMVNGVKTAIAEKWKSPAWTLQSVPIPAEAASSQLDGVACKWSNWCVAVGRYTTKAGATKSLAMFWNGTNWMLQPLTDPVGATQSTLLDVACTGQPAVCIAVGGWKNGNDGNKQFTLAYRFNGSSWTLQSTPNPSGSIASVFQDVSCKTTTSCAAVGSWVSSVSGPNQTLAEDWNGSTWSLESTPNVSGGFNGLFGLECRTYGCMGVGYSTNSSGVDRNLSELRSSAPKSPHLTYSFGFPPSGLPEGWENALREAMRGWSHTTPLTFTQVTPGPNKADLEFTWSFEAGNGQAFDGLGGKVVRAYGPLGSLPGDIYFDQNESWTTNASGPGIDIQPVAEDAVAHALGITGSTAYETATTSQRGLTWEENIPAVQKFGPHPDQRRYFLRNSNTEGPPDIVFESPADGPDSEFAGDLNGDGHDTIGWYEQHNYLCGFPFFSCPDTLWLYPEPHTSGTNVPELGNKYIWEPTEVDRLNDDTMDWFLGKWDGNGNETLGYFDGEFTLLNGFGKVGHHFNYGQFIFGEGPIPLVGDWDRDGKDTIGVFFRSNSTFYLRNSNSAGNTDIVIPGYAIPGDQPVVGDWDGDGKDTIGIYRPSSGQWRLNNENANNAPEYAFYYGNVGGWVRVVGDWNKDGKDTPGFAQD